MSYLGQPTEGFSSHFPYGLVTNPVVAGGSADALPVRTADVFVTTAGVNAMTLATPVAGVYQSGASGIHSLGVPNDDGKKLRVRSTTANAHTITTASNKVNGNKHIITFSGAVTDFVDLEAFNGVWWVMGSSGATLS